MAELLFIYIFDVLLQICFTNQASNVEYPLPIIGQGGILLKALIISLLVSL